MSDEQGIETRMPATPSLLRAEEILRKRAKAQEIIDYQERTRKRENRFSTGTHNEQIYINRRQEADGNRTRTLLENKINAALEDSIWTLKKTEEALQRVKSRARNWNSERLFNKMEVLKYEVNRSELSELESMFQEAVSDGERYRVKALGELCATRALELAAGGSTNDPTLAARAKGFRAKVERILSTLEYTPAVEKIEEKNHEAQRNLMEVLDRAREADRIFGWDTLIGWSPFSRYYEQLESDSGFPRIIKTKSENESSPYPAGYHPIKENI